MHDEVRAELRVDRVADRRLRRCREDRDESDERDTDDERGRGSRGSLGVPGRIFAGERAGRPFDARKWRGDDPAHASREQRSQYECTDEDEQRADSYERDAVADTGEEPDEQHCDAEHHRTAPDREADAPARLPLDRDVAQCRDRRDTRRLTRRHHRRQDRDHRAHQHSRDDRTRLDHDRGVGEVDAEPLHEGPESDREEHSHGDADERRQHADDDRFAEHLAHHLPLAGADRAQQRHLARALGDDDREGVVDDDGADDQGDEGEDQQGDVEEAELLLDRVLILLGDLGAGDHLVLVLALLLQVLRDVGLQLGLRHARLSRDRDLGVLIRLRSRAVALRRP